MFSFPTALQDKEEFMQHALIVEDVPETSQWLSDILTQAFHNMRTTASA